MPVLIGDRPRRRKSDRIPQTQPKDYGWLLAMLLLAIVSLYEYGCK